VLIIIVYFECSFISKKLIARLKDLKFEFCQLSLFCKMSMLIS